LWGNAVLSRYPIIDSQLGTLPPESLRLRRGYILAEVDAGSEQIQLIDTHLHDVEADSDIRQEQVPGLIEAWNMAPRTILTGDFNAIPDSPEIQTLANAGLVDVGGEIGPLPGYTFYSADPSIRIDYIWISADLVPNSFQIPETTASDHLPLLAVISWE
jgi:endonuclease/exonuclease/phosphatase family metal-dependent hydrolase